VLETCEAPWIRRRLCFRAGGHVCEKQAQQDRELETVAAAAGAQDDVAGAGSVIENEALVRRDGVEAGLAGDDLAREVGEEDGGFFRQGFQMLRHDGAVWLVRIVGDARVVGGDLDAWDFAIRGETIVVGWVGDPDGEFFRDEIFRIPANGEVGDLPESGGDGEMERREQLADPRASRDDGGIEGLGAGCCGNEDLGVLFLDGGDGSMLADFRAVSPRDFELRKDTAGGAEKSGVLLVNGGVAGTDVDGWKAVGALVTVQQFVGNACVCEGTDGFSKSGVGGGAEGDARISRKALRTPRFPVRPTADRHGA
jgi:hypothetical protein